LPVLKPRLGFGGESRLRKKAQKLPKRGVSFRHDYGVSFHQPEDDVKKVSELKQRAGRGGAKTKESGICQREKSQHV